MNVALLLKNGLHALNEKNRGLFLNVMFVSNILKINKLWGKTN